jgi:hypothetical protein
MTLRIHLFGRHANRTPAAYLPYRRLLCRFVEYVDCLEHADVLILGAYGDILENLERLDEALGQNPELRLAIVSEEPLWDTVGTGNFRARHDVVQSASGSVPFTTLNHFTSDIFNWYHLPYYITTSNDFFTRYRNYFLRNARLSVSMLREHLQTRMIHNAFLCERRVDTEFIPKRADAVHLGLSVLRSQLADRLQSMGEVVREGKGWRSEQPRQCLPDWHLDKLVRLDRRARFVAAIENTLFDHYITEKIFDAFAVLAIPLYVANPSHRVFELAHRDSFVNLLGIAPSDAHAALNAFRIDSHFLDAYCQTQQLLFERFMSIDILYEERMHLVLRLVRLLEAIVSEPAEASAR